MNLEMRYNESSKNVNFSKYNKQTKFNVDRSNLNVDAIPTKYDRAGKLFTAGDTSNFNIDSQPVKYKP